MMPYHPDAKIKLVEATRKAFSHQTVEELSREFDEWFSLLHRQFTHESMKGGDLPGHEAYAPTEQDKSRQQELYNKFFPRPAGP